MVADAIRSLVNAEDLKFECARVLHETLVVLVLMYGSKTMSWKEKEGSKIRVVQMDNPRRLLGIRRMDRVQNARIRQLCTVTNVIDERIKEGVFRCFCHVERMEDRIAKKVYVEVCAGNHTVGRPR